MESKKVFHVTKFVIVDIKDAERKARAAAKSDGGPVFTRIPKTKIIDCDPPRENISGRTARISSGLRQSVRRPV